MRDNQQFNDDSGRAEALGISSATWPLAGLLWDSSRILALLMNTFEIREKRILEVGCGVGLSTLLLNTRLADITATDCHPDAEGNLAWNLKLNDGEPVPFFTTGWQDDCTELGGFDLIIGSDLLYQPDHPNLLAGFIDRHARTESEVIIVDPSRGRLGKFGREMTVNGFTQQDLPSGQEIIKNQNFKGQVRSYSRAS